MSDLPMPIATILHHSFTTGFCNAGIVAWAGPRDKALSCHYYLRTKLLQLEMPGALALL